MTITAGSVVQLPALRLGEWEPTKDTLHLWGQIVGKVRMASTAPKNHWWHVPLYVGVRGLTTRRMRAEDGIGFELTFDFVDHRLVITTSEGAATSIELVDGLSVAQFDEQVHSALAQLGIEVAIRETSYGLETTTDFRTDRTHASYDREAVERFWHVLEWTADVFEEFAGWFCGKSSPVHVFWHSFDLALTRFGGRRAPAMPDADRVTQETYTHEVVSLGFWPGDRTVAEPGYYAYAAPEPAELTELPLLPEAAAWTRYGSGSLALLPYEAVRTSANPRATLLAFLESAYRAGAGALGWDRDALESSWCPSPAQLSELLAVETRGG